MFEYKNNFSWILVDFEYIMPQEPTSDIVVSCLLLTSGSKELLKGKDVLIRDCGVTYIFVNYVDNYSADCSKMYNPKKEKNSKSRDMKRLNKRFYCNNVIQSDFQVFDSTKIMNSLLKKQQI